MRNLLDFLIKYSKWFLFIIYVIISCMLLFNNNPYQHYIYLTSANKVSSLVFKTSGMVTSYFHLHDINEDLQRQNASLESEVIWLRKQLALRQEEITADSIARDSSPPGSLTSYLPT